MTIKLSSFANVKSVGGRSKVSFKNLSPHKEEAFYLYLYNKGIQYRTKEIYYYEGGDRDIDGGELLSLIEDWFALDLEIDSGYENSINTIDVLNAMYEFKFPVMNKLAERILRTGKSGYNPDYEHDGVIARKNREIANLIYALEEKDKIINEKERIIKSLRKE